MRRLLAVLLLTFWSCGPADLVIVDEPAYDEHDIGELTSGLTAAGAGGCDTSIAVGLTLQLVEELNCIAPNTMVDFRGAGISIAGSVQPYLAPAASAALHRAVAGHGTISINSAYRSVAQQYLLYKWWQAGQCGIQVAAVPGTSNHQSGRAIDVSAYNTWRPHLEAQGWDWLGSSDLVHFDYNNAPNLGSKSVLAFQRLWNKNHATGKLSEDGQWGPASNSAMAQSPVEGFPVHGCAPPPPPPPPPRDAGTVKPDAGVKVDAGATTDAGGWVVGVPDAGPTVDGGVEFPPPVYGGCSAAPEVSRLALGALAALALRRRSKSSN